MPKGLQIFKQTDLLRAIRTSQNAGLFIARVEIDRDGKIVVVVVVVVVGESGQESASNDNGEQSWDAAVK
jgi:hypothetical protein